MRDWAGLFDELVECEREAWDPRRASWQTDQLYRVEGARRALREARRRAAEDWAWQHRHEEEARRRAEAYRQAEKARKAYWASPEGIAEAARYEAERQAAKEEAHREDLARRRHRLPAWVEWAAWQRVVGKRTQQSIGEELGGVAGSVVGRALMDFVYLHHPDVTWEWLGACPLDSGARWRWLKLRFKDVAEPLFPGRVTRIDEPLPQRNSRTPEEFRARNEWVYRQRLAGRTLQEIAGALGLCRDRINQICERQAELDRRRRDNWPKPKPWRAPVNRGRVIDLGDEVRDVWLEYRLDEPIEDLRGMWL